MDTNLVSTVSRRHATRQPGWVSLARVRFACTPAVTDTKDWLDFWEEQARASASRILNGGAVRIERSRGRNRLLRYHLGNSVLIFDGDWGICFLSKEDGTVQWGCAEDCLLWRSSIQASAVHPADTFLSQIAEHLLSTAEFHLQGALERGALTIWARKGGALPYTPVSPDRWRLYKVRAITSRVEKRPPHGDLYRMYDPVMADGPRNEVLCEIQAELTSIAVQNEGPGGVVSFPKDRASKRSQPDRRKKIRWDEEVRPFVEAVVRRMRRNPGRTATGLRDEIRDQMKSEGIPADRIPQKTTFDDWFRTEYPNFLT